MQRSTYYVVQFWASPRPDVDKYVCVPDSWLKWIDKSKAIASVAYPEGNPADIEELARNNRSNPNDWLAYNAYVTSFTNSYEQAMEYLRALRKIKSFGTISIVPTNERQTRPQEKMKSPAGTAERPRVSRPQDPVRDDRPSTSLQASLESRSTDVSQETSRSSPLHDVQTTRGISRDCQRPGRFLEGPPRPQPTATTSSSGGIGANSKAYKRSLLTRAPISQKRPQQMQSSTGTARNSSVSGTQYPVHDDHPNKSLRTSLESRPTAVPQHNSPSTSMRDVQATQNFSHECQRPGTTSDDACCATKFDAVLEKIQANVQKLETEINHLATVNVRNNKKLEEVGVWVKDYQVWKRSVESQLRERPLMSGMPRNIKAEIILIDDDDVNHGNSTIPNQVTTPQESRGFQGRKMAQFSLPPEYDRNDSRWTLRHRYPRPTLIELVPHSRVYVNSIKLANSLVSAKDCKSLARLLVMEVFSDNALKVCSFTGARSTIYSYNSPVRPGLDEHARNTLVTYVKKCGRQKGWRIPDVQSINKTMRNKLQDCRRKARNGN